MDKYAKRLQTRLSSKGFKFTKEQCRQALTATAANPDLPTDEEMVQAFNWLTQRDSESTAGEIQSVTPETTISTPETFDIPVEDMPCLQPPVEEEETEAIAPPETEEGQSEGTLSLTQEEVLTTPSDPKAYSSSGIVPQSSPGESGVIPQTQVKQMVASAFANQPQDFKDQVTEYALQHSFGNVRQVQAFLEQLRGMEFNLLVNTLNDHFNRRGSMLTLLEEVIESQKQKDGESSQNFSNSFNNRLLDFQREMQSRLSKTGL